MPQIVETECASCHRSYPDWTQANFLHAPVPRTCLDCHADGRPDTPTHQSPQGLGDCASCHIVTDWTLTDPAELHTPLPASCLTCHQDDPQPQNIFHTQVFEAECASCHRSYPGWTPADFLHAPVPSACNACHSDLRPATPTHQSAAGLADCARCHVVDDWAVTDAATLHAPLPASCLTCHQSEPRQPTIFHAQVFDAECASCHHEYPGWTPADFLHAPVPGTCVDCHSDQRPNTATHQTAASQGDCASCHIVTPAGLQPTRSRSTRRFRRLACPVTKTSRDRLRSSTPRSPSPSAPAVTINTRVGRRLISCTRRSRTPATRATVI